MGFLFGLLSRLIKLVLYIVVFATVIVLIPNLPPYSKFTSIELEPALPRTGALAPNGVLNSAKQLYKDKLLGPEAFQIYNGEVYTSLATGEIVKLSPGGHVTFVTKLGYPCTGLVEEEKCGRPLDFKINEKERQLYVADAYHGIWKVDLSNDKKQLLVSPRVEIEGRKPRLFNSLTLASNGDFYWTDSCSEFSLKDGAFCSLADPSGRLFHYNAAKNSSKVLVDDLWFANGVALSADQQFVVVVETSRFRLLKHFIAGPKKGQTEVFVAGLPGTPDNVRALPDGSGVLVGLYTVYDDKHPLLLRNVANIPALRKLVARLSRLAEIPFEFLNAQFPHFVFQNIVYSIGSFQSMAGLLPPMCGLVQIDWNGNIVASYYNTDKSLKTISDAIVYNDMLYLGSPTHHNFVGSVPAPELLKQAFKVKQPVPQPQAKQEAKPVKQEPVKPKVEEKKEVPKAAAPVNNAPKPAPAQQAGPTPVKQAPPPPAQQAPPPAPAKQTPPPAPTKQTPPPAPAKQTPPPAPTKQTPPPAPAKQTPPPAPTKQTPPPAPAKQTPPPAPAKQTPPPAPAKQAPPPPVKPSTAVPQQVPPPPKPSTPKPAEQPKVQEAKPTVSQPKVEVTTAKPAVKPSPAPAQPVTKPPPPADKPKPAETKKPQNSESTSKNKDAKPKPEQIPIVEEIPSDTVKPSKDTIKVIKKEGPAEIPNYV